MIQKYIEIFSSPLFQVMLFISIILGFIIYRYFVVNYQDLSEEEKHLQTQLAHYGWVYKNSISQNESGPFGAEVVDNFSKIKKNYTYHKVYATDPKGQEQTFWAKIEYASSVLSAVYWNPKL